MSIENPNDWRPGVLSAEQISQLIKAGYIEGASNNGLDYSSLDLHIDGEVGYRMLKGSVKPFGPHYFKSCLDNKALAEKFKPDDECFTLKRGHPYVFKLKERFNAIRDLNLYGLASGKTTIGRVDVLARLIVDGMKQYDYFEPSSVGNDLFLEVIPITFYVRVKAGTALSQLRFFKGPLNLAEISTNVEREFFGVDNFLIVDDKEKSSPNTLTVDLDNITIIRGFKASAYCAIKTEEPIDLWEKTDNEGPKPNPCDYWRLVEAEKQGDQKLVNIKKDEFYILRSKERICLPQSVAVYCRAMDETFGEMRIHYAGFVHPFFGKKEEGEVDGTPLIFEVRGHNVDINLTHGEKMANLSFYQMSLDAKFREDEVEDPYNKQTLKLSKIFNQWPDKMEYIDKKQGTVKQAD